ncbi:MAG: nucleotide-binding domain containing protein, partial [Edaphobacter sp.]
FPAGGRTTINGHQLVHGTALHESETWRHQESLGPTHIPSALAMAGLRSVSLGLELVRSGGVSLRQTMKALAATVDVLVCDVETDEDLRAIADASLVLGRETVWAGSAGLAYHLPLAANLSGEISDVEALTLVSGPTLIVIGSMSSVSREQVDLLEEASHIGTIHLSPRVLLAGPKSPQWVEHARNIATMLQSGRDTLVVLKAGELLDRNQSRFLSSAIGSIMKPLAGVVGALVASGGETARAILDGWGINSLRMMSEVEPGLPYAVAEGWSRSLPILTKAGAFGSPRSLLHCWEFLHALDRGTKARISRQKDPDD